MNEEQHKQVKAVEAFMMFHNGNAAYQIFTGKQLKAPLRITNISLPINAMPKYVGIIDPELSEIESSNDVKNPDGGKIPEKFDLRNAKKLVKRPKLRRIK